MNESKLLYVDDEKENLVSFKYLFNKKFNIYLANSAEEGFQILRQEKIHIVISDQKMPKTTGVEFLREVTKEFPDVIKILLTGYADINTVIQAINLGEVYRYLTKPFEPSEMELMIKNAIEVYSLRMQNKELLSTLIETNKQLNDFNLELEKKVIERTIHVTKALEEIQDLKQKQDGDYYLTSLLIEPLSRNTVKSDKVNIEFFLRQKKEFFFKGANRSIGGDINIAHNVKLLDKSFVVFVNGDAMGKSTQGAGGAIVFGTAFEVIMDRVRSFKWGKNLMPDEWIYNIYQELHRTFLSFEGLMMLSMVIGILEEDTGKLFFINAEHPFPVLYRNEKASFINTEQNYNKLGFPSFDGMKKKISISNFQLIPNDILILGSDGRDDVITGIRESGRAEINEDQTRFLNCVEKGKGNLDEIYNWIQKDVSIMDDLSLLKINYIGTN